MRVACGAVIAVVLLAGCGEQRREQFASGATAYDLDTNDTWLRFRLEPAAAAALQKQLRELPEQEIAKLSLRRPRGHAGGWPEGLIEQQPANDGALHARVFRGTGERVPAETCLAFERETTRVYAWISGEDDIAHGQR